MESTLIVVTLLSLAMAVAMGIVAWRLVREEHRRSEARSSALAELASRDRAREPVLGPPRRSARDEPLSPGSRAEVLTPLFRSASTRDAGGGRVLAVAATLMVASTLAIWQFGGSTAESGAVPLELTSLAHDRQGNLLRITGLVQNPTTGPERRGLMAVAFLFDGTGRLIASGRAPLEFARLAPGDESPFVIAVGNAGDVVRYRIGFRARNGTVLTHVDRRTGSSADRRSAVRSGDPVADVDGPRQP